MDENDFFRQATLRICGSLDIETSLWNAFEYLENFMPLTGMNLVLGEQGMPAIETLAQVSHNKLKKVARKISLPQEMQAVLEHQWMGLTDVGIINQPDSFPVSKLIAQVFEMPEMSTLTMRLKINDSKLFALVVYSNGLDQYTRAHANLLSLLHDPFAIAMSNALKHQDVLKLKEMLADDNRYLHNELLRISGNEIIGRRKGLKKVFDMVRQVAPLNSPVLLLGETGSGKEVIANAIHYSSPRRNGPFIKVNCGAIPDTLIDSELFGHEKGAFTGALFQKRGRFERAHKGTILLDEIGELPQEAQVRLLRVIQNQEIERVGGTEPISIDIRIIACTHRNLEKMVLSKQFREDLWFRLNVFPINIPPLRERIEDIAELVDYFMKQKSIERNIPAAPVIASESIEKLKKYHWPGNVRELENFVERTLIQNRGKNISDPISFENVLFQNTESEPMQQADQNYKPSIEDKLSMHMKEIIKIILPESERSKLYSQKNENESLKLDDILASHINKVLKITRGKVTGPGGASELMGLNPSTLRSKMKKIGLSLKRKELLNR
ncbi:MAG: sigma-54-dependent Fis family transcriptional regulator [Desulfobacterium sp.]|nr:sigma-54-dependent Fis family transcriptional regulator [Desulfobacterium sp.]MBU3947877.1 sigma-54 dependent transcriptional regulator [Pseudomonadota bacterium]MBU4035125.1 sigma-54 dependent transcriptional regulator [Pseudomonadota bacterium]